MFEISTSYVRPEVQIRILDVKFLLELVCQTSVAFVLTSTKIASYKLV